MRLHYWRIQPRLHEFWQLAHLLPRSVTGRGTLFSSSTERTSSRILRQPLP
jgi:hypothetical protein